MISPMGISDPACVEPYHLACSAAWGSWTSPALGLQQALDELYRVSLAHAAGGAWGWPSPVCWIWD